ncbi:MAG: phage head-tail connector protein [Clostridia bacterium]|nr:phage head-tail connector protein [Clostridia bacterium]
MMPYSVKDLLGNEPVTLAEIQERLHALPGNADEAQYTLTPMITAAREYCESRAGYAFVQQRITAWPTLREIADGAFYLPRPPIAKVESVTAYRHDGTSFELTDYQVAEDGRMMLTIPDPAVLRVMDPVAVTYIAGAEECPEMARQAMMLLIGHWYQNRESVQTGAVTAVEIAQTTDAILKQYKRWW